jgi:hypothetical protein
MAKNGIVTDCNTIRKRLLKDYDTLGTWEKVGQKWGLNRGLAFMIAVKGYEPKNPHLRNQLGLPSLILAPACPKCGVVHVTRRCTGHGAATKHWRDWPEERIRWALEHREEMK